MVVIRECKEKDFEQVLKLLEQLWPDKKLDREKLHQILLRGLKSESQSYICAVIDENLVGFCSLTIKNSLWQAGLLGHIDELIVDKHYHGKGIGSMLLGSITKLAKEKGCRRIELDSAFNRAEAHKFYEKNGFEKRAYLFSKEV
jgi:glucosamine-phosphate N-acetyltransferase